MKKSKRLFELCADILFPRRCPFCDAVLGFSGPCAVCGPALACIRRPLRQPVPKQGHALEHLDAAYAPYFYEPPVRDAVLRLKFEKRTDLARPLALLQAEELKAAGCLGDVDVLVPVPSGRGERRSRGYDVPLMLARAGPGAGAACDAGALQNTGNAPANGSFRRGTPEKFEECIFSPSGCAAGGKADFAGG